MPMNAGKAMALVSPLATLAGRYLCRSPSSVASKRVFSTIGTIMRTEKLCFLYQPLLDGNYSTTSFAVAETFVHTFVFVYSLGQSSF